MNKRRQKDQGGDCSKILVCGPSNKSVDLVAREYYINFENLITF